MSRKKTKIENEEKDARFRRIAEPRILKMLYQLKRLIDMTKQKTYIIKDKDAQKILDTCTPYIDEFVEKYRNKATNTQEVEEEETTLTKIF